MGNLASVIVVGPTKIDGSFTRELAINRAINNMKNDDERIDWMLVWGDDNVEEEEYIDIATHVVDDLIHAWNNAHEYRDINLREYGDKVIFVAGGDDDNLYLDGGFTAISKADALGILDLFGIE